MIPASPKILIIDRPSKKKRLIIYASPTERTRRMKKVYKDPIMLSSFHPEMALFPLSVVLRRFPRACPAQSGRRN